MDVIVDRVCGLDVHKDTVKACVRVPGEGKKRNQVIATFGTKTANLLALRDWLEQWQVTDVAMESTGEYWKPVYYVLEDRFHVVLANAAHIKNVPGRKTDAKDGAWIAQLLECGLVAQSFVAPREIREIRDFTRYRKTLIQQRTEEVLRLHGVLQRAGIKLSSAATNPRGCRAERCWTPEWKERAMQRRWRNWHGGNCGRRFRSSRRHWKADSPHTMRSWCRICWATSISWKRPSAQTAEMIIGEIGVDMKQFPAAGNLASWAGICPGNKRSAGKRKPEKIRKGGRWLNPALTEATWAAVKENDSYLSAQYHRLVPHKGKKKAAVAVSHSMLIAVYYILKEGVPYKDLGSDYFVRRNQEAIQRRYVRQLEQLGFQVKLEKAA